jgi:hypothetical protein
MSLNKLRYHRVLLARTAVSWTLLIVGLVGGGCPAANAQGDPAVVGQWSSAQPWPYLAVHMHMLPTGKVAFWADYDNADNMQLWDPATGTITSAAKAGYNIFCSGHTFLADGRLFVTGGHIDNNVGPAYTYTYNPFSNSWTRLPDMNAGRWYPTNTALANGDMLVVSGDIDLIVGNNTLPQVWQTASSTWRDLTTARLALPLYPYLYLAPNGRVFNAGPNQNTSYLDISGTGTWTTLANSNFGNRGEYTGTSVMYDNGKVMIIGGGDTATNTVEVIDLNASSPAWRYVGAMTYRRRYSNATLLPDGKVLVTGGTTLSGFNDPGGAVYAAEMWDPATENWSTLASMAVYRGYHSTSVLLPDGRVLSSGGTVWSSQSNAEIYSPPYLFRGTRPAISSAPATVDYGQTFFVGTPDATNITKVNWIRLSSVTHAFNMEQRINRLTFSQAAGGLNVTAPADSRLCPPGYYMLFILNGNGVPAVARIIRIGAATGPVPPSPAGLTATAISSSQINLAWIDNATNESGFKIERSTDGSTFTQVATVGANATSYSNTGLAAGMRYYYRIRATNGNGDSPYTTVAEAVTFNNSASMLIDDFNDNVRDPAKWIVGTLTLIPQDSAVTALEQNGRLEITPLTNTNGGHYNGYRTVNTYDFTNSQVAIEVIQKAGGGTNTAFSIGLSPNDNYRFILQNSYIFYDSWVGGVQSLAYESYSPTNHRWLRIRHDQASNTINWETSADGNGWTLKRSLTPAFALTAASIELASGSWQPEAAPGKTIFDNFALSYLAAGVPTAPSNLVATGVSSSQISLTWADNSGNEDGFRVERCQGAGCTNFTQIAQLGLGVTSYNNTGLVASTTYRYQVRAFNAGGNSPYSNISQATTQPTAAPAAPSGLQATAISATQINLAWMDNSSNEEGFEIERCQGDGCTSFVQNAQTGANVTSYSDTGRAASTTYSYRVRAYNSGGNSTYSNAAQATTPAPPPASPSNLTATAISSSQINLSWVDNSGNENGFMIERCQGGGCTDFVQITTVGPNIGTYSNTGLKKNTTYFYRMRSYNASGNSAYSNTASARTQR